MKNSSNFKAVLFDLDGTLIDTAPDLGAALNHTLASQNKPLLELAEIRPFASDGTKGLLKLGFNITEADPKFLALKKIFLDYYSSHIADHSVLFPGMKEVLNFLKTHQIPWGIVTNKITDLTHQLLKKLNLDAETDCIVCGDTLAKTKPDPEPLLYAAKLLNIKPEYCCYVGDAERDMVAAKAAHMKTIFAAYGYIHKDFNIKNINPDYVIDSVSGLRNIL